MEPVSRRTSADDSDRHVVPLTELEQGSTATLVEVRDEGSHGVLRAMGLTDACRLRLCKLGDPCIVQVRATRIGVSRQVAARLFVIADPQVPR